MLRILLAALAAMCLCIGACATTGTTTVSVPATNPLTPATSHFWCGEHCSLADGCEEGLLCICGNEFRDEDGDGPGVSVNMEIVESAFLKLRALSALGLQTVRELNHQPYEIRVIYKKSLGKKMVCGTFLKYAQFGTTSEDAK